MPSVLIISSEIGSEWRTILGHPQLSECMGICVLSLAHESELKGFRRYLHIVFLKNLEKKKLFKFSQGTCP